MKKQPVFILMAIALALCLVFSLPLAVSAEDAAILSHIYTSPRITGGTNDHPLRNLWISGEYMYLCEEGSLALSIWDISNPGVPTRLRSVPMPSAPLDIKGDGEHLYVSARNRLVVLSIASPSSPVIVGTVSNPVGECLHGIYLHDERIYAADFGASAFVIFNVSNPTAPYAEGQLRPPSLDGIHDVVVEWPFAYVAAHYGGITKIDVSNPINPQVVWVSPEKALFCHITKQGNHIFAGGACPTGFPLYAYDISGNEPYLSGTVAGGLGYWIAANEKFAVTVDGNWNLAVVDISNPGSMSIVARWSDSIVGNLRNVIINNEYVYAVSGNRIYGFILKGEGGVTPLPPPEPEPPAPEPTTECFPIGDLLDKSVHIQISEDTYLALFPDETVDGTAYKVRGVIFSK